MEMMSRFYGVMTPQLEERHGGQIGNGPRYCSALASPPGSGGEPTHDYVSDSVVRSACVGDQ